MQEKRKWSPPRAAVERLETRRLLSAGYHLSFDDEFNSVNLWNGTTNPTGWHTTDANHNHALSGNGELQYYSDPITGYNPFTASGGVVSINADKSSAYPTAYNGGQPYLSGELTSYGFLNQQYGYFELRAKLPAGQGFWPAFWMLPSSTHWPPEYDIFEVLGNDTTSIHQTTHWKLPNGTNGGEGLNYQNKIDSADGFHTYGFLWTPTNVAWTVDGAITQVQPNRVNEKMYMLINLAVGGTWPGNPDATTPFPSAMQLDYVRVYSNDAAVPMVTPQSGYAASAGFNMINSAGMPAGWSDTDINSPAIAGSATFDNNNWTLRGAGSDIWGAADQFNFASTSVNGDATLTTKITSLVNGDLYSEKAGLMMRNGLAANAMNVSLFSTSGGAVSFQVRSTTGGTTTTTLVTAPVPTASTPVWLKLVRSGNTYTAFYSTNGTTFTQVGTAQTVAMTATIQAGIAITSHAVGTLGTATFTDVQLNGTPAGWTDWNIDSPPINGTAAYSNGTWTVTGNGYDIAGSIDQFNLASQSIVGDGSIVVKMTGLVNGDQYWEKGGIMFRDGNHPGAMYASVVATSGSGVGFIWRDTTGAAAVGTRIASVARPTATNPLWLKLTRTGNSFSGFYSTNGTTWIQIGTAQTVAMASTAQVGMAVTSHDVALLGTATFSNVVITGLPEGYSDSDIGTPGMAGGASYDGSTWTVNGGGYDIAGTSDQFNFLSQQATGDTTLTTRVTSLTGGDAYWEKAGLMMRDGNTANAMYASVEATTGSGVIFQYRTAVGGTTTAVRVAGVAAPSASTPVWLKLSRAGNGFSAYYSTDGSNWTQVGTTQTIVMNSVLSVGLAVTSHLNTALGTATFTNLSVTSL